MPSAAAEVKRAVYNASSYSSPVVRLYFTNSTTIGTSERTMIARMTMWKCVFTHGMFPKK